MDEPTGEGATGADGGAPRKEGGAATGSLIAAVALYALSLLLGADLGRGNPADPGFGGAIAALVVLLLWIAVGVYVMRRAASAALPGGPRLALLLFVIVAAVASLWSLTLIEAGATERTGAANWVRVTPLLLPPLFALFGWLMPRLRDRSRADRRRFAIAFAAAALALSAMPAIENYWQVRLYDALDRFDAAEAAREEAEFRALGPANRVDDFLPHLAQEGRAERALAGIRASRSRQADAIRLVGTGRLRRLERLSEFDLEMSGELCAAYRSALARWNADFANPDETRRPVALDYRGQVPNLRVFMAEGCDLSAELNRAAAELRALRNDPYGVEVADELDAIPVPGPAANREP